MCDWRTFTAESNLVRESEAILYSKEQRNDFLDHLKWCSHLPDLPVFPDFLESFLASFLNCDLLIVFFFIQLYSKHVVDSSFDMQSFLSMSNEIYGRSDVYTSQLVVLAAVVNQSNTRQPTTPSSLRARRLGLPLLRAATRGWCRRDRSPCDRRGLQLFHPLSAYHEGLAGLPLSLNSRRRDGERIGTAAARDSELSAGWIGFLQRFRSDSIDRKQHFAGSLPRVA